VLPVPVDAELFVPNPSAVVPCRLGFAGRFNDPRKNIALLLRAVAQLREAGSEVTLLLMGDWPQPAVTELIGALGLQACVSIRPGLSRTEMRDCMQTLDLFVLPSHQEGLCLSALEAMACGVPVVSTRCGGPEEFVLPGVTGSLVGFEAQEMASSIASILNDREQRLRMSKAARALVENRYVSAHAEAVFAQALRSAFPDLGTTPYVTDLPLATLAANASVG